MARVVVLTVLRPVIFEQLFDRYAGFGQNIQPQQHRPQAVFFANVVGAGACRFFATQCDAACVQQIAKEFPAGWGFKAFHAQFLRDAIDRCAGWHGARHAADAACVGRCEMGVGRENRQCVRWCDGNAAADDEVAVAIAVGGGTEIRCVVAHHQIVQFFGMHQIRVGVMAAEIGGRRAVEYRAFGCAEEVLENRMCIRAGDGVHGVKL